LLALLNAYSRAARHGGEHPRKIIVAHANAAVRARPSDRGRVCCAVNPVTVAQVEGVLPEFACDSAIASAEGRNSQRISKDQMLVDGNLSKRRPSSHETNDAVPHD